MKITVNLEQHQLKNSALVQAGLSPRALSLKPGQRVHANRKHAASLGRVKHKGRVDY